MKKRKFRIVKDDFNGRMTVQVKAFNLFWTTWFSDGEGCMRGHSSTDEKHVYEFLEKIERSHGNVKFVREQK